MRLRVVNRLGPLTAAALSLLLAAAPVAAQPAPQPPAAPAAPLAAAAPAASSCQWMYYPIAGGHLQAPQAIFNDPDDTSINDLSTGLAFLGKTQHMASRGLADFNGDNQTDVLRVITQSASTLHWQYSLGGVTGWNDLGSGPTDLRGSFLRLGDFNFDNYRSDVFADEPVKGGRQWEYSPGSTGSFLPLHTAPVSPDVLDLGDFNGDGVTDVFTATNTGLTEQWGYFAGGTGNAINLAHDATDPHLLRFGDFNGDGTTDVLAAAALGDGSIQLKYSPGGALSYLDLMTTTVPYSSLKLGDFDGDSKTDLLAALPQPDGGVEVMMWPGGLGPSVDLGHIAAPEPALKVGDFNDDGIDDLLALRCDMAGPVRFGPRQVLAPSGYDGFFGRPLSGDVNGDGRQDAILYASCQNPLPHGCTTNYAQLGTAVAQTDNTFHLTAPQTLGPNDVNFVFYRPLVGDFNGDGRDDVALVDPSPTNVTVYVATSNGDGSFSMGSAQVFNGDFTGLNPIAGDFNGDGKADVAMASVCFILYGSCNNGDANRVIVLTTQGTTFTLGAEQDFPPATGWVIYYGLAGDVNGDGKTDLVFATTDGGANRVYIALATGAGNFSLSSPQNYGNTGWSDFNAQYVLMGDVNGDRKMDLVWSSFGQAAAHTFNNLVVVGLADANGDGGFQLGPTNNFGSSWSGLLSLADLNRDGRADLVWNHPPIANGNAAFNTDVYVYGAALSSGDGTFHSLGSETVNTNSGAFAQPFPPNDGRVADGLTLAAYGEDRVSHALIMLHGALPGPLYLPMIDR